MGVRPVHAALMRLVIIVLEEVVVEDNLHFAEGIETGAAAFDAESPWRRVRCTRSTTPLSDMMNSAPLVFGSSYGDMVMMSPSRTRGAGSTKVRAGRR